MPVNGEQQVKLYEQLKAARSMRDSVLNTAAPYVDPSRGRIQTPTISEGEPWMTDVYDSQGLFAADLGARYLEGYTASPGKKWFNLRTREASLMFEDEVKEWLEECRDRQLADSANSNFYSAAHQIIKDWWSWGCGGALVEERPFLKTKPMLGYRGTRTESDMIGRFVVSFDAWGEPSVYGREFMLSVGAAVERFGIENVSTGVRERYNNNHNDEKIKFIHMISPRGDNEQGYTAKEKFPFKACYVEHESKHVCEEGGYKRFPASVPRQNGMFGEDYGRGRADIALNDLVTLSTSKRMSFEDWALKIRPITFVRNQVLFGQQNLIPGSFLSANWNGGRPLSDAFYPYQSGSHPEITQIKEEELRSAIREAFFVKDLKDLLQIEGSPRMTAYERGQRERMILKLMAAIYGDLERGWLSRYIDQQFYLMYEAGAFSPPPDIILEAGGTIDVVFDSPLANAQVIDELSAMDEFMEKLVIFCQQEEAVTGKASALRDLVNWDVYFQTYGEKLRVPALPMRSAREIAQIRESRDEAERAQLVQQELQGGAEALGKVAPFLQAVQGKKAA